MNMKQIIFQAKNGRPDLAAMNAGVYGRYALALYVCRKYPHSDGTYLSRYAALRRAVLGYRGQI